MPESMTIPEAAAWLGLAPSTLRKQIANRKLRARKAGVIWLVPRREVERYQRDSLGQRLGGRPRARAPEVA